VPQAYVSDRQVVCEERSSILDNSLVLNRFLAGVEARAYRMAQMATGNADEALDIVQEAMLKLAQRYAGRDAQEWGPLFHRILQSRITDWYRRRQVRNRFRVWLGRAGEEDDGVDAIQTLPDPRAVQPEQALRDAEAMEVLQRALDGLPLRQRQAFLLRAWEGLGVRATAQAMSCSDGSVKTHYSRALKALRKQLGEHWP